MTLQTVKLAPERVRPFPEREYQRMAKALVEERPPTTAPIHLAEKATVRP